MCKIKLKKLLNLKLKLSSYYPLMPKSRSTAISKEIENLYHNIELKNSIELDNLEKIIYVKLSAYKRLYANKPNTNIELNNNADSSNECSSKINNNNTSNELNNFNEQNIKYENNETLDNSKINNFISKEKIYDDTSSNNNIFDYSGSYDKFINVVKENNIDLDKEYVPNFEEMKNSVFFNPKEVKLKQENIINNLKSVEENKLSREKERLIEKYKTKRLNLLKDVIFDTKKEEIEYLKNNLMNDFEKLTEILSINQNDYNPIDSENLKKNYIMYYNIVFGQGGEEHFEKVDFSELKSKNKIINSEFRHEYQENDLFEPDDQKRTKKMPKDDGIIEMGLFGDFKITLFEEEEDSNDLEEQEKCIINGKEVYVWKEGKLIPGQAEKRQQVNYINWNSSNINPKDAQKHRELLHRQHFKGPLWEGIKKYQPNELPMFVDEQDYEENSVTKEEAQKYYENSEHKNKERKFVRIKR